MSGVTIRDVVIKIAIEQAASNLRMPNTSEVQREIEAISKQIDDVFNKKRSFGVGAGGGGAAGGSLSQKTDPLFGGRFGNMWRLIGGDLDDKEEYATAEGKAKQSLKELTDLKEKDLAKTKEMGLAVLQLAKGLSLLGASQSSTAREWLKYAAAAQGAYDTLESLTHIIGKLPGGGALGGLLGRVAPLAARGGLIGGSIAGIALGGAHAVGAASDLYHGRPLGEQSNLFGIDINGDTKFATAQEKKNQEYYRSIFSAQKKINKEFDRSGTEFSGAGNRNSLAKRLGFIDANEELKRHRALADEQTEGNEKFIKNSKFTDPATGQLTAMLRASKDLEGNLAKELDLRMNINHALDDERQKLQQNVDLMKQSLDVQKERFAGLARLDQGAKIQLKELGKFLAGGGELDEGKARLAERFGVAKGATEKFRLDQFKKDGFADPDVMKGLELGRGVDDLQKALTKAEGDQLNRLDAMRAQEETNNLAMKTAFDKLGEAQKKTLELLQKLEAAQEAVIQKMDQTGQKQVAQKQKEFPDVKH